jgi:DNA-binding response OmpR family regulator
VCRDELQRAGHSAVIVTRPLELLNLETKLHWDLVCLDNSDLGRSAIQTLSNGRGSRAPLVGIGIDQPPIITTVRLPMVPERLVALLEAVVPRSNGHHEVMPLILHPARRTAEAIGKEVGLTRTEYRLLEFLLEHKGEEIAQDELLKEVWGFQSVEGGSALIRAHVRNLRTKLDRIGLPDVIRARRGRGYALVV